MAWWDEKGVAPHLSATLQGWAAAQSAPGRSPGLSSRVCRLRLRLAALADPVPFEGSARCRRQRAVSTQCACIGLRGRSRRTGRPWIGFPVQLLPLTDWALVLVVEQPAAYGSAATFLAGRCCDKPCGCPHPSAQCRPVPQRSLPLRAGGSLRLPGVNRYGWLPSHKVYGADRDPRNSTLVAGSPPSATSRLMARFPRAA